MFTPKVDKPQTKTDKGSSSRLVVHRPTSFGHQIGHDPHDEVLRLQRTIGNQATMRLLQQQGLKPAGDVNRHEHGAASENIPRFHGNQAMLRRMQSGLDAKSGSLTEKIARLKDHEFLCPPVADTLTNISKLTGGGGTLGSTKIDKSSVLECYPKTYDFDQKSGTCSFKPVTPNLSITSKFTAETPEALTADSMPVPGCGDKPVPIYGKVTKAISDLVRAGEQEHCDDLTISFNQTLKPCAAEVNKFAGKSLPGKNTDECFKSLRASLGFDPIDCSQNFVDLTAKDDERDSTGMHDFDPDLISKDCKKIVIGYKKSATNKVGDPSVAPSKFIPAATKCAKTAPAAKPSTPPPKPEPKKEGK
jgi:hypothetical protein